ncbi:MAG TPA: thioredoxin reductase [Firmicutes bacterium]|nr:thioredoxin reductase [Bacillota bacterium]
MSKIYDVIIIGAGAAGLSAGIYCGRAKMSTLILEKNSSGGQAGTTQEIVNYPGVRKTSGPELMHEMHLQAEDFGAKFTKADVLDIELEGDVKVVKTNVGDFEARSIIIAGGASPRQLGFIGEEEFKGRGIAYCATCDGEFYSGLEVFVVGAGFAAAEEAIFLTRFARKVTIIAREPEFTCAKTIADKVLAHPQIDVKFNTEVVEVSGEGVVNKIKLINNITNETEEYVANEQDGTFGVFIFAGYVPQTTLYKDKLELDPQGYIITNDKMETNLSGVYAAGDLRPKVLRQIVTAVADGAIASTQAEKYVASEYERLGIEPQYEEAPVKKEAEAPKAEAPKSVAPGKSALLNDALRQQIAGILARMEKEVTLVTVVDETNGKSIELRDLVLDMADLGDKLHAKVVKKGEDVALEAKVHADKFPVVAMLNAAGEYSGVKFHGVPGGHELNSFILSIYNLAGPGQALEPAVLAEIKSISKPTNLKIAVSLSCHLCPDVVVSAQRLAIENENIEAEMLDLANFNDLKTKHKIMSVPALIINDEKVVFGSKSIAEMVQLLK